MFGVYVVITVVFWGCSVYRVIFRWLATKNLKEMNFDHIEKGSPEEVLMGLKTGTTTYAMVFDTMCTSVFLLLCWSFILRIDIVFVFVIEFITLQSGLAKLVAKKKRNNCIFLQKMLRIWKNILYPNP